MQYFYIDLAIWINDNMHKLQFDMWQNSNLIVKRHPMVKFS